MKCWNKKTIKKQFSIPFYILEGDNSLASEAIDITNGSDEYSDTETAHECVVILGDKDFDLINRVARIEAKMNTFEEEKVGLLFNYRSTKFLRTNT